MTQSVEDLVARVRNRRCYTHHLYDQPAVEPKSKEFSDRLRRNLPGYHPGTGPTIEARRAIAVFERRYREAA